MTDKIMIEKFYNCFVIIKPPVLTSADMPSSSTEVSGSRGRGGAHGQNSGMFVTTSFSMFFLYLTLFFIVFTHIYFMDFFGNAYSLRVFLSIVKINNLVT